MTIDQQKEALIKTKEDLIKEKKKLETQTKRMNTIEANKHKVESELTTIQKDLKALEIQQKIQKRETNKKFRLDSYPEVIKNYRFSESELLHYSNPDDMERVNNALEIEDYKRKLKILGYEHDIHDIYLLKEYSSHPLELSRSLKAHKREYLILKIKKLNEVK